MLKIALLHNSNRRARLHRATNDSGQNEAERSNACIGDALVDGGSLKWEYYEQYHGLEEKDLKRMSAKELEDLENDRMKNQRKTIVNSWVRCLENNQLVITSGFPTVNFRK